MSNDNQNGTTYENDQKKKQQIYVGGSSAADVELDERDEQLADEVAKAHKKQLIIAISAVIVAVIAVAVYFAVSRLNNGKSASEKLVATYMSGLETADVDKVKSVMDSDTVDDDSINTLIKIFQTYNDNGIEYTLEYTLGDGYDASDSVVDSVSKALYNKSADKAGVKKGYIVPVKGTIQLTYNGQSSPYDMNMEIICYEKDGKWFLGGTVEKENDVKESDTEESDIEKTDTEEASESN